MLPPNYLDEVQGENIPVCALLEMPDRYRFHSTRGPAAMRLSDSNDPALGQGKRSGGNLFHSNAPGLRILTDANLAPAEREPSILSILSKSCSDPAFTDCPKYRDSAHCSCHGPIIRGAVFFDPIFNDEAFRFCPIV
jgi:hypothetical protein